MTHRPRLGSRAPRFEPCEPRRLYSSTLWEIHGDTRPTQKTDTIQISLNPTDPTQVQATVNGTVVATRPLSTLKSLRILSGQGADTVTVNLGPRLTPVQVLILGGPGNDALSVTGATCTLSGGAGDDSLTGGAGNDSLDGGTGSDLLQGNAGDDTLTGGDGNDVLAGGAGRDRLDAGAGDDRLHGGDSSDNLLAGTGNDTLYGGAGADRFTPSTGRDKIYRDSPAEKITGNARADVLLSDPSAAPAFHSFTGESDFDHWLIDAAVRRWQDLFGQPPRVWFYGPTTFKTGSSPSGPVPLANAPAGAEAAGGSTPSSDHSTTNTQVAGVDEADIIQTDGQYLYTAVGSQLLIIRATPADQMTVLSRTDVGGDISGLYLAPDGRLTVLASVYDQSTDTTNLASLPPTTTPPIARTQRVRGEARSADSAVNSAIALPPIGGADVWWTASKTLVATYDVSNPAAPAVAESTTLDGYLADSRAIDGRIYAVVSNDLWLPAPEIVGTGTDRRYESQSTYTARLQSIVSQRELPSFTSTAPNTPSRTGPLASPTSIYVSGDATETESLTSVILIDPSTGSIGPDSTATIAGPAGTVYATANSLYITGWDYDQNTGTELTNLAKFSLTPTSISLAATGSVEGSILDQFSMGENSQGDLNIATSSGWGNDASNNVYTLRQSNTSLDPVGALLNIAPGENIFSSRFIQDQGYLVTFHQTDPLFSLDLSDPSDPKVAGRLNLTGFSSFLQPIESHYLLGLGHSGDAQGNTGGLQLSLFDTLDPAHPKLVATYAFDPTDPANSDGSDTGSEAEYDPHAIQYFPAQHTLALPIWQYDPTTDDFTEGTAVLSVDLATGFHQTGFIPQDGATRSVRIDQTLYTLGSDTLISSDLANPSTPFSTVTITDDTTDTGGDGGVIPLKL